MEKLYDVASAAQKLGDISPSTVRAWLSQGRLNRTKLGRRTMVSESELERLVREGQRRQEGDSRRPRSGRESREGN
jgi:excisionase family DNA binding protein